VSWGGSRTERVGVNSRPWLPSLEDYAFAVLEGDSGLGFFDGAREPRIRGVRPSSSASCGLRPRRRGSLLSVTPQPVVRCPSLFFSFGIKKGGANGGRFTVGNRGLRLRKPFLEGLVPSVLAVSPKTLLTGRRETEGCVGGRCNKNCLVALLKSKALLPFDGFFPFPLSPPGSRGSRLRKRPRSPPRVDPRARRGGASTRRERRLTYPFKWGQSGWFILPCQG